MPGFRAIPRVLGAIATLAICLSGTDSEAAKKSGHPSAGAAAAGGSPADWDLDWQSTALAAAAGESPAALTKYIVSHLALRDRAAKLQQQNTDLGAEVAALRAQVRKISLETENRSLRQQLDDLLSEEGEVNGEVDGEVEVEVEVPCSAFELSRTRDCPSGKRHAKVQELERCQALLCKGVVPKWGIVNGHASSISGSGYRCTVTPAPNQDGGESICVAQPLLAGGGAPAAEPRAGRRDPTAAAQRSEAASEQDTQDTHSAARPGLASEGGAGGGTETAVDASCDTLEVVEGPECAAGRHATLSELGRCKQMLCDGKLAKWGIAHGAAASIRGKAYKCTVEAGHDENGGGESICVIGSTATVGTRTGMPSGATLEHVGRVVGRAARSTAAESIAAVAAPIDPSAVSGDDWSAEGTAEKRAFVRQMMSTAWQGYRDHAWGENELRPTTRKGLSGGIFGPKMGASIVDSLDTLYLMDLTDELAEARAWVASDLTDEINASVSVFETIIRFIGGLLSAFALTNDQMYRDKALQLAARLLPAFKTKTGVPTAAINLMTGANKNWGWAPGKNAILSEFGTLQLEFEYLSDVSGNGTYKALADHVVKTIFELADDDALIPNYLNVETGKWGKNETSLGPYGDSFYEYLLKVWIYRGGRRDNNPDPHARALYDRTMATVRSRLHRRSSQTNLLYVSDSNAGKVVDQMWHLTCFVGGLYALSAMTSDSPAAAAAYRSDAADITHTCHESYDRQPSKLGPERMVFKPGQDMVAAKDARYILRPETVESYFYLWRTTKDTKYRRWAWEAAQAIERNCRCGTGYCGIKDVKKTNSDTDNVQQSFFLAETLKYLYLTFSDDSVLSLDEWVFNTEAHPFPIRPAVES